MARHQPQWWRRTAQSLSRAGLLWLALTAVALGSLVSSGSALAPNPRLVAASSIGSGGKLRANGPAAPAVVPGELTHRAYGPDTHAGGTPAGLVPTVLEAASPTHWDRLAILADPDKPAFRLDAFNARAPPARA